MSDTPTETPPETFRILFLGDIVGEPGRKAVTTLLPLLREQLKVDFAIVNGENSAAGRGITPKIAITLMRGKADVITTGDHIWDQKEIIPFLADELIPLLKTYLTNRQSKSQTIL